MNNKNTNKRARKGFTLVEIILAMTISTVLLAQAVGVVNSVLRVNRNVLRDNLVESNMRNMVYNVSQILRTASVSFIVGPDKFDGESDASGVTKKLTPGWNYLGVSSDKREFCLFKFVPVYKMDPTTNEKVIDKENSYHQKQVLARSGDSDAADITFNFHVTGNEKERLLNFVLTENIKWQGENLKKQIDTSVYAMNSRNVNGAEGICVAYRNDPIEVDRASGEARFMLCLDVSGSMMYGMNTNSTAGSNNNTGTSREKMRIGHLENALTFLVDNLATNDLITLGMVSYSSNVTTVYYPNISSSLGQFTPTPDNPDTKEDPNADERYFTVVSNSIDDLKNNIIKQYQAKSQYGANGERDMLFCGGSTNTGDAIRTGMAMLRKAEDNSRSKINHLILLTDGEPNIVNYTYHPDNRTTQLIRYSDDNSFAGANGSFWYYDIDDRNRCANRLVSKGKTYDGDIVGGAHMYYNRPFPTYEEAKKGNMQFYGVRVQRYHNTFRLTRGQVMNHTLKNVSNEEEYNAAVQSLLYGLVPEPYLPWVYGAIMANRNFENAQDVYTGGKYRLGYYGTFGDWVMKRSVEWCSEVFLKKNKESRKNPNGFIKKFHIIGFGPQNLVKARCMEVVNAVNSGSGGKEIAVYYEGTDTESLKKIFDGIIKEINNDLWFVEGPKPVTPATPGTP